MNPEEYFNPTFFTDYFKSKLRLKKGGALDGLTPDTFWKRYERELEVISKRCLEGTYKFSPYLEKLILKGKDKLPRMLSVPSMRDRMVFGALNKYLQDTFPEAVNHEVPNQYIKEVSDSNTFLAVATGVSLFMTFKDMKMKYHKWINTIAASTFGVLLLHANSDTKRQWLWRDTLQNAEQFYMSYACVHAMISVITIFAICIAIDYIRIHTLEKWMFIVIDKYLAKYKLK